MSCINHPDGPGENCPECWNEAIDREMDNDMRSAVYGKWYGTLKERKELAQLMKIPEPTE